MARAVHLVARLMKNRIARTLLLAATASLSACGVAPPEESTATSAAAITQSGTGRFEALDGTCIVPAGPVSVGTGMQLGTCAAASANKFALGPSVGVGDVPDGQTRAPTVRTGAQGTLMMGGLCLEATATGTVRLNACQHSCQQSPGGQGEGDEVDLASCPEYPGGVGLNEGSANGLQEWTWSQGQLQNPQTNKCLKAAQLYSAGAPITLGPCTPAVIQESFLPIDFALQFASGILASVQNNGPFPLVAPLVAPVSATTPVPGQPVANFQCLDRFLNGFLGATPLDAFQCNATDAQWYHFDGTGLLQTTTNVCVGAPGGPGAGLVVEGCTGATEQQWVYAAPNLQNRLYTGFCMDVTGESKIPLASLDITPCSFHLPGQTWTPNLIWPKVKAIEYQALPVGAGWISPSTPVVGDFDHNGFSDVAYIFKSDGVAGTVNNGRIDIDVYLSDGHGLSTNKRWSMELGGWVDNMSFYAGDFNGDGYDDIAAVWDNGNGQFNLDVHKSTGSGFAAPERWATAAAGVINPGTWLPGDFDGNGTTDLAHIFSLDGSTIDIDAHLSKGSLANGGFAPPVRWASGQGGWIDITLHDPDGTNASYHPCEACSRQGQWVTGDFNADQKTDLALVFSDNGGRLDIDTHLSTGSAFVWQRAATNLGGWIGPSAWVAEDMDNDGRADIVGATDAYQGIPALQVYSSSVSGLTIPAGQSGFAGFSWGGLGPASPALLPQEMFFETPDYHCPLFCHPHAYPLMGSVNAGNFVHRIGSGFGDVIFVEPRYTDQGSSYWGSGTYDLSGQGTWEPTSILMNLAH
jgi:hypothetical protein